MEMIMIVIGIVTMISGVFFMLGVLGNPFSDGIDFIYPLIFMVLGMILFGWGNSARAKTRKPFYSFPNAKFIEAMDGDTIRVHIPSVHPIFGFRARVRVLGVDTPELRPRKGTKEEREDEKKRAKAATAYVKNILENGKRFRLDYCLDKADSFGRPICKISNSLTDDLAADLIKNGHGVPYDK